MTKSQLFLIDANALCYRSFFAIRELVNSKGQATNAVFGFVNTLRKILREHDPAYLGVCFDLGPSNRQEKYAHYKIQRPSMPNELVTQIPLIKDVVRAYNVPVFEKEGFEADDIIATIAAKKLPAGMEVVIVSDDKDMYQLMDDRVKIFSIRNDRIMSAGEVKEKLGVEPRFITDYIGLAGDKVDNIPGVKGIGDVSARNLINQYGELENILTHVEELTPPRVKERLAGQREQAVLSKDLARLDTDVPLEDFDLENLKVGRPDYQRLFELFRDFEFKRWAAEAAEQLQAGGDVEIEEFGPERREEFRKKILQAGTLAFYSHPAEDELELYISCGEKTVCRAVAKDWKSFQAIFENPDIGKITYDLKAQLQFLRRHGIGLRGEVMDAMLAGYLLLPPRSDLSISALAWYFLKLSIPPGEHLRQAIALFDMAPVMLNELKEKDLDRLLQEIEVPLTYVLFEMQECGVNLDCKLLAKFSLECEKKIDALMKELYREAGEEFNLNSPKQLSHILFEKLKLPVLKKTKTGFSTNEEVLVRLAEVHPLPALILEYRQLSKLKSTYLDALPKLVNAGTGYLHGVFNQIGAETGRLSSNNPNLQNIPIKTEMGRRIRKAFIPFAKDHVIVSADYSQIELRILAHLSGDKNLMRAFQEDQDIHAFTAAQIFDVKEKDVDWNMRNTAKRVNFGIVYGMSAFGLSKDLKIPQPEAKMFIDRYFARYPGVKKFMEETVEQCEKDGYVKTILNRRRYIPEINSSNIGVRQFAQRQAINTPVQGSAADLIKLAMINIHQALEKKKLKTKMIMTVHDELVFDVPKDELEAVTGLVRKNMENAMTLKVPVKVTIKQGASWLEAEEKDQESH